MIHEAHNYWANQTEAKAAMQEDDYATRFPNPEDWKVKLPISTQGASDNLAWREGRSTVNPKPLDWYMRRLGESDAEYTRRTGKFSRASTVSKTPPIVWPKLPLVSDKDIKKMLDEPSEDPTIYYKGTEALDKMVANFGLSATITWCRMTAYKYSLRMGKKAGNSVEQEAAKISWYLEAAERLTKQAHDQGRDKQADSQ